MVYASWSVVFGEQPSATKWNILGTNDAHFYSFLGDSLAWTSYSPTLTNITIGNGSTTAKYIRIGNTIHYYGKITAGSTTSFTTDARISLPVNTTASDRAVLGTGMLYDSSATSFFQIHAIKYASAQTLWLLFLSVATTPSFPSQTGAFPVSAGTGDEIHWNVSYEAA